MIRKILALVLALSLSACSMLGRWSAVDQEDVGRAIDANQYSQALDLIDLELARLDKQLLGFGNGDAEEDEAQRSKRKLLKANRDEWAAKKLDVQNLANDYQAQQLSEVRSLITEARWTEATHIVNALQTQVPGSEALSRAREDFSRRRLDYIDNVEHELAVIEAKHLPVVLPLYERLANADPDNEQRRQQWVSNEHRRDAVLLKLRKYADEALANRQPDEALDYLSKIQKLVSTPEINDEINQLKSSMPSAKKARVVSRKAVRSKPNVERKNQEKLFQSAVDEKRWLDAMDVLTSMMMNSPDDPDLLEKRQYLQSVFDKEVDQAKALGEQYYSAGEIEKALATWQSVRAMAPEDPQLQSNIERAQRILQKVESLKGNEGQ